MRARKQVTLPLNSEIQAILWGLWGKKKAERVGAQRELKAHVCDDRLFLRFYPQVGRYFEGLDVLLARICSPVHIDLVAVQRMLGRREGNALCKRMLESATVNRTPAARRYWRQIARKTIVAHVRALGTTLRGQRYSSLPFAYEVVELDTFPATAEATASLDASWYHGWQQKQ
jgi:hypothetical protein